MSSKAQWSQRRARSSWQRRLVTMVAWLALAALVTVGIGKGYQFFMWKAFGEREVATRAHFSLRTASEGVKALAVLLIESDGTSRPNDLSQAFKERARAWLAERYPAVELREADIQSKRVAEGKVAGFRIWYVLVDKNARLESTVCTDPDGTVSAGPC